MHEFIGETVTRLTWTLFFSGVRKPFTAEYNRRMRTGTFSVDGKIEFQWSCEDPSECPELPYTMTKQGQKFALSWLVTDTKETFELRVNDRSLNALKYLDSGFKLEDDKVSVFRADTKINNNEVTSNSSSFEHLTGLLTHKILEMVSDVEPVTKISFCNTFMETEVMNETIASLA